MHGRSEFTGVVDYWRAPEPRRGVRLCEWDRDAVRGRLQWCVVNGVGCPSETLALEWDGAVETRGISRWSGTGVGVGTRWGCGAVAIRSIDEVIFLHLVWLSGCGCT